MTEVENFLILGMFFYKEYFFYFSTLLFVLSLLLFTLQIFTSHVLLIFNMSLELGVLLFMKSLCVILVMSSSKARSKLHIYLGLISPQYNDRFSFISDFLSLCM